MASYLKKRGRKFHFRKRVPKALQSIFNKDLIQIPLGTDSESIALQRAGNFNLILEDFWKELIDTDEDETNQKFRDLVLRAKIHGFQYISKQELVEKSSLVEFINRLNSADLIADKHTKEAILGGRTTIEVSLSKVMKEYFEYEEGNLKGYSENQIRKWKNPKKRAMKNFISVVNNKPLTEITRKDILEFRTWWINRIKKENLAANSANKEFGIIKRVINTAIDNHALNIPLDTLFKGISLKNEEKTTRYPFSTEFIQKVLLKSVSKGLNNEAKLLIFAMADTGARIGELTGLEKDDIILNTDVPYIKIRPNQTRVLKTPQSERDLPLVGASLYAFKELGGPFKRYFGKPDLISNTINKYCRENNLFPSKHHSLYSLRHSFEDRLTAVEPPDKVQAALMGHKYVRPRYGAGPSLEQKRFWLEKIAFNIG